MTLVKDLLPKLITDLVPDLIGAEPPSFVIPTDLANLVLWGDPADASTVTTTGSLIDLIEEKSSENNDMAQSGAARPSYIIGGLNGKNIIRFNGTGQCLSLPGVIISGTTARTFFFVIRGDNTGNDEAFIDLTIDNTAGKRYAISGNAGGSVSTRVAGGAIDFNESIVDATNFSILVMQSPASSIISATTGRINGVAMTVSGAGSIAINTGTTGITTIGNSVSFSQFFDGEMGDMIAYDRLLPLSEVESIEDFLSNKWAISIP